MAEIICSAITNGRSLRSICEGPDKLCSVPFVLEWLKTDSDFVTQYTRAREAQADYYAEQIIDIGDNATAETAQVARLQCDNRKWYAGKIRPKKYGDRPDEVHVNTTVNTHIISADKLRELQDRRMKSLPARV